ncbi:MAG: hypothetical protein ACT4PV_14815 [Planctomycetaceae bacterium]
MTTRLGRTLEAARALMASRDSADTTPVRLPHFGGRPVRNLGQVEAALRHAAGQMAGARAARRKLLADPERAAWHRQILKDCVASARSHRRWARVLARPE